MEMNITLSHLRALTWTCVTAAASLAGATSASLANPNVAIVFDGSGSMWGTMPGSSQHKFKLVIDAILKKAATIPPSTRLSLVTFGQKKGLRGGCQTTRTLLPLSTFDLTATTDQFGAINPQGGGPIVLGLQEAAAQLSTVTGPKSILLVHDGPDNCGQDICAAAREIRLSQPNLRVHTLSLIARPQHQANVQCLARSTNGQLIEVFESNTVDSAVANLMRTAFAVPTARPTNKTVDPEKPTAQTVEPKTTASSRPPRKRPSTPGVMLSATLATGGNPIEQPLVWSIEGPIGRDSSWVRKVRDPLPSRTLIPGKYKVALHLPDRIIEKEVSVPKGPRTLINFNLDAAQLSLAAVLNRGGKFVQDASFQVKSADGNSPTVYWDGIAPRQPLILPAGDYQITTSTGHVSVTDQIKLAAGQQLNHDAVLNAGNLELVLEGQQKPEASKTVITVETDAPDTATGRRVVTRSVQAVPTFLLPAGTYYLSARNGSVTAKDQVAVAAGEIVRRSLKLPAMKLRVRTKLGTGRAFVEDGAEYRIWRLSRPDLQPLISKLPDARFELPRGRYRIESRIGQQNAVIVRDFEVDKTGTGELTLVHEAGTVQLGVKASPPPKKIYWEVRDQNERIIWRSLENSALVTLQSGNYVLLAEVDSQLNRIPMKIESGRHLNVELGRN
ncbi:MAG: VWA domain-containing protein [Pseudomonadota bacterium]